MKSKDAYTEYAIAKYSLPADWKAYLWQAMPMGAAGGNYTFVNLTGAVCTAVYTKGKRKGSPNWDKKDNSTVQTVSILLTDFDRWELDREAETGVCKNCDGSGQRWVGWNHLEGNRYSPCKRCNSTGKFTTAVAA